MPAAPEHANPPSPGTLRIRSIETVPVLAPLARTFRGSFYKMTHRATLVTRVITEEGIVGEAYAGDEDKTLHDIQRIVQDDDHHRRDVAPVDHERLGIQLASHGRLLGGGGHDGGP